MQMVPLQEDSYRKDEIVIQCQDSVKTKKKE